MKVLALLGLLAVAGCQFFGDLVNPVDNSTSDFRGRIVDGQRPLAGVQITLQERQVLSDTNGFFSFASLRTGIWALRMELDSFETISSEVRITLSPRDTTLVLKRVLFRPSILWEYSPRSRPVGNWAWTDSVVELRVTVLDPDWNWLTVAVDWGDGRGDFIKLRDSLPQNIYRFSNVFDTAGAYPISITVDEGGGQYTAVGDTLAVRKPNSPKMSGPYFYYFNGLPITVNEVRPGTDSIYVRVKTVELEIKAFIASMDLFINEIDSTGAVGLLFQWLPNIFQSASENPADSVFEFVVPVSDAKLPAGDYWVQIKIADSYGGKAELVDFLFKL